MGSCVKLSNQPGESLAGQPLVLSEQS